MCLITSRRSHTVRAAAISAALLLLVACGGSDGDADAPVAVAGGANQVVDDLTASADIGDDEVAAGNAGDGTIASGTIVWTGHEVVTFEHGSTHEFHVNYACVGGEFLFDFQAIDDAGNARARLSTEVVGDIEGGRNGVFDNPRSIRFSTHEWEPAYDEQQFDGDGTVTISEHGGGHVRVEIVADLEDGSAILADVAVNTSC